MTRQTIICAGNRFLSSDSAGPMVYDSLKTRKLKHGVILVDGGISGLNLLSYFENSDRVIIVDTIRGAGRNNGIRLFTLETLLELTRDEEYGHHGGLLYLLKSLPGILNDSLPETIFLGLYENPDQDVIEQAAMQCLQMVHDGLGIKDFGSASESGMMTDNQHN